MLNLKNLGNMISIGNIQKMIIQCISTFEEIIPYLTGILSNGNKTTKIIGPPGNYTNAWGKIVQPTDTNTYALECIITPFTFGTGGFPCMGMVDTITGEFAGFVFTLATMDIVNFDGTVNNTFIPIGAPSEIGINYNASTGDFSFWFKNTLNNPEPRYNIAPIQSVNPVRFAIGALGISGAFEFDYTINNGPNEFNIVYPNGVKQACGQSFIDLDYMLFPGTEGFELSNNNRTLTTDIGSAGVNYFAQVNQISEPDDTLNRVMEFTIDTITTVDANTITFGISDTLTNTVLAVAYAPGGSGLYIGTNNGSEFIFPSYVMQVGDVFGVTINRSNGFAQISLQQGTSIYKWNVTASIDTTSTLYGIMLITNITQADIMSITHRLNASEMTLSYPNNSYDFGGILAPILPVIGNVWDDSFTWNSTDIFQI